MVPNSSSWGAMLLLASLVLLLSSAAAQDPVAPTEPTAGSFPAPTDTSPDIPSSAGNSNTSNSPPPLEAAPDNLTPKTTESVQMAQQQQQQDNSSDTGPAVDATQGVQEVCKCLCCVFGLLAFCAHSTKTAHTVESCAQAPCYQRLHPACSCL
jgi:hypothetical protein